MSATEKFGLNGKDFLFLCLPANEFPFPTIPILHHMFLLKICLDLVLLFFKRKVLESSGMLVFWELRSLKCIFPIDSIRTWKGKVKVSLDFVTSLYNNTFISTAERLKKLYYVDRREFVHFTFALPSKWLSFPTIQILLKKTKNHRKLLCLLLNIFPVMNTKKGRI